MESTPEICAELSQRVWIVIQVIPVGMLWAQSEFERLTINATSAKAALLPAKVDWLEARQDGACGVKTKLGHVRRSKVDVKQVVAALGRLSLEPSDQICKLLRRCVGASRSHVERLFIYVQPEMEPRQRLRTCIK